MTTRAPAVLKSSTEFYCRTVLMLKVSVTLTLAVKRHRFVIFNISARPGALDAVRPGHLRPKVWAALRCVCICHSLVHLHSPFFVLANHHFYLPHKLALYHKNIAKGTTDPRVEFILPSNFWGHITSSNTNLDHISYTESRLSIN